MRTHTPSLAATSAAMLLSLKHKRHTARPRRYRNLPQTQYSLQKVFKLPLYAQELVISICAEGQPGDSGRAHCRGTQTDTKVFVRTPRGLQELGTSALGVHGVPWRKRPGLAPGTIPARPSTLGRRCPSAPRPQPVAACRGKTGTATGTSFANACNSSMPCMPWRAAAESLPTRAVSALTRCHGSFRKVKKRCRRADFACNHAVKPE